MSTIQKMKSRHSREIKEVVVVALNHEGWNLSYAAKLLGIGSSSLQRLIETHELGEVYSKHNPGPGRPKKQ